MMDGKVLVLGDDTRSFLAIVRSLGRQGIEVHAAPANFGSLALRSRYIARVHYLPFWMGDGAAWLEAFEALLAAERFDLVIPCNETTLLPIQRHRARLERLARLAIPDDHSIAVLFDKHETRELARELGIPVSAGRLPQPGDTAEGLVAELGSPVVVKPRKSYSPDQLQSRGKVQVIHSLAALQEALPHLDADRHLLEAFFPGHGAGVSLLASRGKVLQAFEHHRVREAESGSYYRVSAPLTPALEAACSKMVAALGYTGVAMFEFRLGSPAPGGTSWVLLEVNARPWGSMPLPVALGVDFPARWHALMVHGTETPPVPYRAGVYGRNFLPDLWSTVADVRQAPGARRKASLAAGRVGEFARAALGRERHDVLVHDDVAPGLLEVREVMGRIGNRVARKLPGSTSRRRARTRKQLQDALRQAGSGQVSILFVCQGNICRSPFAAALLRARLQGRNPRVEVRSFGMLPRPGRPTPEFGIAAAAAKGIDLRAHRSAHLTREEAEAATAILVFDEVNREAILNRYPGLRVPILFLGDFAPEPVRDIADPVDGGQDVFTANYSLIESAVDRLAEFLVPPQPAA